MVMVHPDGRKQTVSYPKYLVEVYLNRYLSDEETVDHIDGDFTNNDLSNLRVVERSTHSFEDVVVNSDETHICIWCKSPFIISGSKLRYRNRRSSSGFCSKKCTGQYGAWIQKSNTPLATKLELDKVQYKRKSALGEIPNVEEQNIGEALTCNGDGNTEA